MEKCDPRDSIVNSSGVSQKLHSPVLKSSLPRTTAVPSFPPKYLVSPAATRLPMGNTSMNPLYWYQHDTTTCWFPQASTLHRPLVIQPTASTKEVHPTLYTTDQLLLQHPQKPQMASIREKVLSPYQGHMFWNDGGLMPMPMNAPKPFQGFQSQLGQLLLLQPLSLPPSAQGHFLRPFPTSQGTAFGNVGGFASWVNSGPGLEPPEQDVAQLQPACLQQQPETIIQGDLSQRKPWTSPLTAGSPSGEYAAATMPSAGQSMGVAGVDDDSDTTVVTSTTDTEASASQPPPRSLATPPRSPTKSRKKAPAKPLQKSGKRKKSEQTNKPKRPLCAYNLFFRDERAKLLAEKEAGGSRMTATTGKDRPGARKFGFAGLAQHVAAKWRLIDPETRLKYDALASEEMETYMQKREVFLRTREASFERSRARLASTIDEAMLKDYIARFEAKTSATKKKRRKSAS